MQRNPLKTTLVGTQVGSYRVCAQLGAGGAGNVYLAEHTVIGTKVAMKVLQTELAVHRCMNDRFLDEARASAELSSPHLPRYFDFGHLEGGEPYAVMELLQGETLADRLDREPTLPVCTVVVIAQQIAQALEVAHQAGIVHRDVKPENIFLTTDPSGGPQPYVKVLDFGIAKRVRGQSPVTTGQGVFVGSPAFCAPEQAMALEVDGRADVYALGVTMYLCLTGRLPVDGDMNQILLAKVRQESEPLRTVRPDVPHKLAALIDSMLARDPHQRPATMAAVQQRLTQFEEELAATVTMPVQVLRPLTLPPVHTSRWPRAVAVSSLAMILALMVGIAAFGRKGAQAMEAEQQPTTATTSVSPRPGLLPIAAFTAVIPDAMAENDDEVTTPATAPAAEKPHRRHHRRVNAPRNDVYIANPFTGPDSDE